MLPFSPAGALMNLSGDIVGVCLQGGSYYALWSLLAFLVGVGNCVMWVATKEVSFLAIAIRKVAFGIRYNRQQL